MTRTADIAVVGGGVIGCSIAYHLARRGLRPVVFDKGESGGQASGVSAGMLAAQEEAAAPDAFFELCLESRERFEGLASELQSLTGIDPVYERCGVWRAADHEEDIPPLREKIAWQVARGFAAEWQEASQVSRALPGLKISRGALYCPRDGQVDTRRWVRALAEGARRKGAQFEVENPVVELLHDSSRVFGLRTREDTWSTGHIVLAAGAWTGPLLETLGVSLPFVPVKGQVMVLSGLPRAFQGPVFAERGYIVPKSGGRLIIGGTMERVGFDARPTLSAQRILAEWAARWCPGLQSMPVVEFQAGLRPGTEDNWPIIGPLEEFENLSLCAGHFRNGILLSPLSGDLMAQGLADGRWSPALAPFSPRRFSGGALPSRNMPSHGIPV